MNPVQRLFGSFRGPPPKVEKLALPRDVVGPKKTTVLQERGWRKVSATCWEGPYATKFGTWLGVMEKAGDRYRVLIKNPPMHWISAHPKRACFHERSRGYWFIHMHTEPVDNDLNALVLYVERVITEAQALFTKKGG